MRIATKAEIERVLAAVQKRGLTVCQVSFDENGNPVVKCMEDGENRRLVIDELKYKPSHEVQSLDEWKAKQNADND